MSKPPSALANIEDFLRDQNRSLYNVTADGNCMFRALAHQLCGSEEYHIQLRSMLLQVIQNNHDTYSRYWIQDRDIWDHLFLIVVLVKLFLIVVLVKLLLIVVQVKLTTAVAWMK